MQSAISGIVDDISGILKLALMTSEDFDGRLHTYAIGIKLALGPNLQVCNPITKTAPNLHWTKLAKLAIQVSRLGPRVQTPGLANWVVWCLPALVYITSTGVARSHEP